MKYSSIITHIAGAMTITVILLVIYTTVQQSHRSSANDPQIQIARDLSAALRKGEPVSNLVPGYTIDIGQSLGVFAAIFDKNGKALQSTGFLNGILPEPPAGVFEFTNVYNEDVLTWQPQTNVRVAMVIEKINAPGEGFVGVGRSLKETEVRESSLAQMIGIAWVACIAILLVHLLVQSYVYKKQSR